tara:strand:+ start:69 stop:548 length:480 start_codon:yes stop_codon:yes gene_type:complete
MFTAIIRLGGFVTLAASVLSACSAFRPESYACDDKVTAIEVGSRVELVTADTFQPIMIRLNGVSASCYLDEDKTVFDVSVGLKITRDLADSAAVTKFQVPFIIAVIEGSETVIGHESFAYRMALSKQSENLYPVIDFQTKAPKDGRIILSLTPETIEIK